LQVKPTAAVPSIAFSTFSLQKTAASPEYDIMVKPKAAEPLTAFSLPKTAASTEKDAEVKPKVVVPSTPVSLQKIAASPDYGAVVKPRWMPRLAGQPDDITRMWTIVHLAMACNLQVAYGDRAVGHLLAGRPLYPARLHIRDALYTHSLLSD
jgi:hypothetical protein